MAAQIENPNKIDDLGNSHHQVNLQKLENKLRSVRKYHLS